MRSYLIVGLGNPGKKYKNTRHNLGFEAVEMLAGNLDFFKEKKNDFKIDKKFKSVFLITQYKDKKIIIAKPETFMNLSGEAVAKLATYFKIKTENILVVQDEGDLFLGKMRLSFASRSAGHRGVESIISELGTQDFYRLRLGVKNEKSGDKIPMEKFVLGKFLPEEKKQVKQILSEAVKKIFSFLDEK